MRVTPSRMIDGRHTQVGCGDHVFAGYWVAALVLIVGIALRIPIGRSTATMLATIVFLGGGLPHGAYDIALLRRTLAVDRPALTLIVVGYVAVALAMAAAWLIAPLAALILFLIVAAVHFGADWQMLEEPLLRTAAGAAVIATATIGHPTEVEALFVAMSDGSATWVARCIMAAAPVVLLVTAVGIAIAWRDGSRQWAAAMALCLILLVVAPPVVGFALFFVFLHSPTPPRVYAGSSWRHDQGAVGGDGGGAVGCRRPWMVCGTDDGLTAWQHGLDCPGLSAPGVGRCPAPLAVTLDRAAAR